MIEPRVIRNKSVATSLVYHIDMAKKASYDLGYLVKYLRSASEIQRIQAEKVIARQFEEQEQQRRMQYIKAQNEGVAKHQASTHISLVYRCWKARKIVREKRLQKEMEAVVLERTSSVGLWDKVQRIYRLYSTVTCLEKRMDIRFEHFKGSKKRKKRKQKQKKQSQEELVLAQEKRLKDIVTLRNRIDYEIYNRQYNARLAILTTLFDRFAHTQLMIDSTLKHWISFTHELPAKEAKILEEFNRYII